MMGAHNGLLLYISLNNPVFLVHLCIYSVFFFRSSYWSLGKDVHYNVFPSVQLHVKLFRQHLKNWYAIILLTSYLKLQILSHIFI